nr:hypothetical protein GCM10020092_055370 [Actinoplanes digitatis]
MAEAVVDLLEAVQVEDEDGHVVGAAAAVDGLDQAFAEQGAAGQAGEAVVVGLVHELFLQFPRVVDVAGVEHVAADGRVVQQVGHGHLGQPEAAAVVADRHLEDDDAQRLVLDRLEAGRDRSARPGGRRPGPG